MDLIVKQGRLLFAVSIVAFGVENLLCARYRQGSVPVMPWVPAYLPLAWGMGLALIVSGVCIVVKIRPRAAAMFLGILFLICTAVIQLPATIAHPLDVGIRTLFFETLTMGASALILAGTLPVNGDYSSRWLSAENVLIASGRYLFAISAVAFGIDHLPIIAFIASLIPAWIPAPIFWAWVTTVAFFAAGVSIAAHVLSRWAAFMLGVMFLLWVLVLHGPRVMSYPKSHNPDEWSSAFIALAVCGGSWILAQALTSEALVPARGGRQISIASSR